MLKPNALLKSYSNGFSIRPFRLSDVNGLLLALAALAFTIVSTGLSEARFRQAEVEMARKAADNASGMQVCYNRYGRSGALKPNG